jgi:hypothetical protein
MKTTKILYLALLIVFFYTTDSFSHNGWFNQDRCGWRTENNWERTGYVQENLVTIPGEILSIELVPSINGKGDGVHLVIETDEGNLRVILGPEWYFSTQQVSLDLGVFVEVKGIRVTLQKEAALLAYEITVDDKSLNLRDESGIPLWRRRGHR